MHIIIYIYTCQCMIILCASFICVLRVEQSRSSLGLESQGKIQHNPPRKCVTRLSKYFAFRELARTAIELTARRCEKGQALESFSSKLQLAGLATSVCLQGNCFIFQYFNNCQHSLKWWESLPSTSRKGYLKPPMGWSWTLPGTGKAQSGGRSLEIDPLHSPLNTLHSAVYTLHSYTLNFTYSTLCIPPHSTLHSLQWLGRICKTVIA